MRRFVICLLSLCVLTACGGSTPPPVQPTLLPPLEPTTSAPLNQASPTAPAPERSPTLSRPITPLPRTPTTARPPTTPATADASNGTFSDPALGISFSYPGDWQTLIRAADAPPGVSLRGPALGQGAEPIIFAITIDVQADSDQTVQAVVDQQLAQVPADLSGGIKLKTLTVGGEPAREVIGLPSSAGALETFILRNGQVYVIILQPYNESNESLRPYLTQARATYDNLLSTWRFLK